MKITFFKNICESHKQMKILAQRKTINDLKAKNKKLHQKINTFNLENQRLTKEINLLKKDYIEYFRKANLK